MMSNKTTIAEEILCCMVETYSLHVNEWITLFCQVGSFFFEFGVMRLRLHWMRVHNKCKRLLILIPLSSNDRCCIQTDKLIRLSTDLSHLGISTLKEYFSLDSHTYIRLRTKELTILWFKNGNFMIIFFLKEGSVSKFSLYEAILFVVSDKTHKNLPVDWQILSLKMHYSWLSLMRR